MNNSTELKVRGVTSKWKSILGVEAAIFALNSKGQTLLLVLLSGLILDRLDTLLAQEALQFFHEDLRKLLGPEVEIKYTKGYDLCSMLKAS